MQELMNVKATSTLGRLVVEIHPASKVDIANSSGRGNFNTT